jgi:hypothetical protein
LAGPTWKTLVDRNKVTGAQIEKTSALKGGDFPHLLHNSAVFRRVA